MKTLIRISDIEAEESYVAACVDDCKCKTDASGYVEAVRLQDVITMGKIVFEPL